MGHILALVALIGLATVDGQYSRSSCDLCIDGGCYGGVTKLIDRSKLNDGSQIALDRAENVIYYAHENEVHSYSLDKQRSRPVVSNVNATGVAVDQNTRNLYISSGRDILRYNPVTNQSESFHGRYKFDRLYFLKDKLYGVSKKGIVSNKLMVFSESGSVVYEALQHKAFYSNVVIDKLGDIYFREIRDTYKLPAGGNSTVLLANRQYFCFTDKDGQAYFIDRRSSQVFKIDYSTNELVKAGAINSPAIYLMGDDNEFYFDKNNNIIHYDRSVDYFPANDWHCKVREEKYDETVFSFVETIP